MLLQHFFSQSKIALGHIYIEIASKYAQIAKRTVYRFHFHFHINGQKNDTAIISGHQMTYSKIFRYRKIVTCLSTTRTEQSNLK